MRLCLEMFGKVDKELGERLKATAEKKIANNDQHPMKTPWH